MELTSKRMIFESVPGKQVSLAHIISNPDKRIFEKLGLVDFDASSIGIMTITPSDVAIIAIDIAKKQAEVEIGFIDRFCGAVCIIGDISAVETAVRKVIIQLQSTMGFSVCRITRT